MKTIHKKHLKRVLAVMMSILMLVPLAALFTPTAFAADTWNGTVPGSATGFSNNHITSAAGLVWFIRTIYNGTDYSGATVYLDTDVNLNNNDFVGQGVFPYSDSRYFRGTFDGQNHTISNFKMTDSNHRVAMFRQTENATFKNVTFTNVNIASSGDYSGHAVLVGYHKSGNLTFQNVHISGGSISGYRWIGALAGEIAENSGKTITMMNCSNGANITGRNTRIGGLAGSCLPAVNATNCSNTGNVTSSSTDVGGIVGWIEDDASSFVGCTNFGTIQGTNAVGGIFGYVGGGSSTKITLNSNTNSGNITATGSDGRAGGIVGHINNDYNAHVISNNTNHGNVSGVDDTGGIVGRNKGFGTWSNNFNDGTIRSTGDNAGGICGEAEDDAQTFTDCRNEGYIEGKYSTGGIIGFVPKSKQTFTRCVNTAEIKSTGGTAGGLYGVGNNSNNVVECYNCENYGTITAYEHAGGLCGYINPTGSPGANKFENCVNRGNVTANGGNAGGLVGLIQSDNTHVFTGCSNYGTIKGKGESGGGLVGKNLGGGTWTSCNNYGEVNECSDNAGGLQGEIQDDANTFTDCHNYADITASNTVGGIFGYAPSSSHTFTNCTNTGNITGTAGTYYVGGIFGFNANGGATFIRCWNTGNIKNNKDAGGLAGQIQGAAKCELCWNGGSIGPYTGTGHDYSYGGLVGFAKATGDPAVKDCYNWGTVIGGNVGGIIGYADGSYNITYSYNTGVLAGSKATWQFAGVGGSCGAGCYKNVDVGSGTYKTDEEFIAYNFSIDNNFKKNTEGVTIHGETYYFPILGWCENSMPSAQGQCRHYIGWTAHYSSDENLYYTCNTCGERMDSECPITPYSMTALPTTTGTTLQDGMVYNVASNTTISAQYATSDSALNGLKVPEHATVVIHIPSNVTLTVNGSSAGAEHAGKAGIYVPVSSTLIITGLGSLAVKGGNGGVGSNGGKGSGEDGGIGGAGGGGGGAGIGGNGGAGGSGGSPGDNNSGSGWNGGNGGTGGAGGLCGRILIAMPDSKITTTDGTVGSGGNGGAEGSGDERGGGGGGGGGGNGAPAIGGGAAGGGGGGGGCSGSGSWLTGHRKGEGGNGGSVGGKKGSPTSGNGSSYSPGNGGAQGSAGVCADYQSGIAPTNRRVASYLTKFVFLHKQDGVTRPDIVRVFLFQPMPSITPPTRTGYDFQGYYTGKNGTGTIYYNADGTSAHIADFNTGELYAYWTPTVYMISYDLNGGTVSTANPTTYTIESNAITLTNPTKTGYTFTGWSGTGLTGDNNMTVTIPTGSYGDRSYTAHWTINRYTITFVNGSTTLQSSDWDYGSTPTYSGNTPTKDYDDSYHYTFSGWSPAITAVTGAATYTAQFTGAAHNFTVWSPVSGSSNTAGRSCPTCGYTESKQVTFDDTFVMEGGFGLTLDVLKNDLSGTGSQQGSSLTLKAQNGITCASADVTLYANNNQVILLPKENVTLTSVVTFTYTAIYDSSEYTATVTVIPAANVYYEESVFAFEPETDWHDAGTAYTDAFVNAARPGDPDSPVYGFNNPYTTANSSTYSMGNAKYTEVSPSHKTSTATFSFSGTGFDLYSVTSGSTGVARVTVTDQTGETVKKLVVDTYSGYSYDPDEGWVTGSGTGQYQVPVICCTGLDYGAYTVTVQPSYAAGLDATGSGSYRFYIDAVRVYDPINPANIQINANTDVYNAYVAMNEYDTHYQKLREILIDAETYSASYDGSGAAFVSVNPYHEVTMDTYLITGPKNEVYLSAGQGVAFRLTTGGGAIPAKLSIGMKTTQGSGGTVTVNGTQYTVDCATELYRNIIGAVGTWKDNGDGTYTTTNPIVITNTGTGSTVISLTQLKWSFGAKEAAKSPAARMLAFSFNRDEIESLSLSEPGGAEGGMIDSSDVTVTWDKETFALGETATLTITAPGSFMKAFVDGAEIAGYEELEDGRRQWTYTVTAEELGLLPADVTLEDANEYRTGAIGAPQLTATVPKVEIAESALTWDRATITQGETATLTVTAPANAVSVTVNGETVTLFTLQEDGTKVFTFTVTPGAAGEHRYTVTVSESHGYTSGELQTPTLTVNALTQDPSGENGGHRSFFDLLRMILEFLRRIFSFLKK